MTAWTAGEERRIERWHHRGRTIAEIHLFLGAEKRSLEAVRQKMSEMGLLGPRNGVQSLPHDAGHFARENLRREVALAKAEIRAGTAAPYKGGF